VQSSSVDQASGGSEPAEKIALGESDYMSSRSKGFSPTPLWIDFQEMMGWTAFGSLSLVDQG